MDLGAAERGGGTQPLFSRLSFCLCCCCLSACLPTFPSACLSARLENVFCASCLSSNFNPLSLPLSLHHFSDSQLLYHTILYLIFLRLCLIVTSIFCIFAFVLFHHHLPSYSMFSSSSLSPLAAHRPDVMAFSPLLLISHWGESTHMAEPVTPPLKNTDTLTCVCSHLNSLKFSCKHCSNIFLTNK